MRSTVKLISPDLEESLQWHGWLELWNVSKQHDKVAKQVSILGRLLSYVSISMGPDASQFLQMSGENFPSPRLLVPVCPLSITLILTNAPREYTSDLKIQGSAE